MSPEGISIFRNDTNTGVYINFTSFIPWTYCTSWIKTLITRASRISAPNNLSCEINIIKRFASWNDFPKSVVCSIINKTLNTPSNKEGLNITNIEKSDEITIYFCVPYYSDKGFLYSNLAFVKSSLMAKKIIQLYLDRYMMSQN